MQLILLQLVASSIEHPHVLLLKFLFALVQPDIGQRRSKTAHLARVLVDILRTPQSLRIPRNTDGTSSLCTARIEEWSQARPDSLGSVHEDVNADIAQAFDFLETSAYL